jgi:methylthioribose-1-phosphate isomerase
MSDISISNLQPSTSNLQLRWTGDAVRFLDQTLLPTEEMVVETRDYRVLIGAIRALKVRGAPLLGIAAGYGVSLAALEFRDLDLNAMRERLLLACDQIAAARPTAVNLFWALDQFRPIINDATDRRELIDAIIAKALALHADDALRCERIGAAGAALINDGMRILTHCNTGALATGGGGTALNVILTAHHEGTSIHVFADETRPLFQGSRLTMWELQRHGVPSTLITDSTAAFLMAQGRIDLAITGADRIAANGDTANKIGTYGLAVAAHHHRIPFYIAAPVSTIDFSIASGAAIPIEQRHSEEVTVIHGRRVAPDGVDVYAPAFDVTPAELIRGIITEYGIFAPSDLATLRSDPA